MILKLALRNIISKSGRTIATIIAIAISVAAMFLILSFKSAIYDHLERTTIANTSLEYSVHVTYSPSGDKTITIDAAKNHEEVEDVVPTLEFYWLYNDDYLSLRGFGTNEFEKLHKLDVLYGNIEEFNKQKDNVIISYATARRYGLNVNSSIKLKGSNNIDYYFNVAAIADDTGYFDGIQVPTILTNVQALSRLILGSETEIYNNLYIKPKDGITTDKLQQVISQDSKFASLIVEESVNYEKLNQNATSFSATVQIVGVAVMILGVLGIAIALLLTINEKRDYIAKLSVIGASKKQIAKVFILELVILALFGLILGVGIALGLYALVIYILTNSISAFIISSWRFVVALVMGFLLTIAFGLYPMFKAFKGTVRDNILDTNKSSKLSHIALGISVVLFVVTFILSYLIQKVSGIMGLLSFVFLMLILILVVPYLLKLILNPFAKKIDTYQPLRIASVAITRNRQSIQAGRLLIIGLVASMLLFSSWRITTQVFTGYGDIIDDVIIVSNTIESDVSVIKNTEGIDKIFSLYWSETRFEKNGTTKSLKVLGANEVIDAIDMEYITDKEIVNEKMVSSEPYVFIDKAMSKLYEINVGDEIDITLENNTKKIAIGGILSSSIFTGNYIVLSNNTINNYYELNPSNIMITVKDGANPKDIVGAIRSNYAASHNYFASTMNDMFKFDMEFLDNVFMMVGVLAIIIAIMFLISISASDSVAHGVRTLERETLMCAGLSKKKLLISEILEHVIISCILMIVAFITTFALFGSLMNALALFGLYFEVAWPSFISNLWIVFVVAVGITAYYSLIPILFNYRKVYRLRAN